MKIEAKMKARELRQQGLSLSAIQQKLNVSKSSVSLWVRNIELDPKQIAILTDNSHKRETIEKRRLSRLKNAETQRVEIINTARKDITSLDEYDLFLAGAMLYWAEGGKTNRGMVRFSNGDPLMIQVAMRYLRIICNVPETKFRGHIHIHSHLNAAHAKDYWSNISGIPTQQFFKTYQKIAQLPLSGKDSLPYGTFDVCVCDTKLFLQIQGWIKGIANQLLNIQKS